MDEHHQHDKGGDGAARVQEFAPDAKEPRQDRDRGSVGTFEAKAEEIGENAEAKSRAHGKEPSQHRDQGHARTFEPKAEERGKNADGGAAGKEPRQDRAQRRVGTFDANAQADRYVSAWPRQVAGFYGRRLRKNVEFGRRFAEVGGIADLLGLQREYVNDMLLDYASSFWSLYGLEGLGLRGAQQTAERPNR